MLVKKNMLRSVVLRYLDGVDDSLVNNIRILLNESLAPDPTLSDDSVATLPLLCQEVGGYYHDRLCTPVFCAAMSVLWMALHKEKFPLLADALQSAAGISGKQRWALILPSSARVSQVTFTTVIGVRYPELDNYKDGLTFFGNYLLGMQSTHGGFLPVFWDAPTAYMHAATDIGCVVEWFRSCFTLTEDENGCLAVLHTRNKMVTIGMGNTGKWIRAV